MGAHGVSVRASRTLWAGEVSGCVSRRGCRDAFFRFLLLFFFDPPPPSSPPPASPICVLGARCGCCGGCEGVGGRAHARPRTGVADFSTAPARNGLAPPALPPTRCPPSAGGWGCGRMPRLPLRPPAVSLLRVLCSGGRRCFVPRWTVVALPTSPLPAPAAVTDTLTASAAASMTTATQVVPGATVASGYTGQSLGGEWALVEEAGRGPAGEANARTLLAERENFLRK